MLYQKLLEQRRRLTKAERRAFSKQIDNLIRDTGKLETQKVDEIISFLQDAKNNIRDELDLIPRDQKFSRNIAQSIKRSLEFQMDRFRRRANDAMRGSQEEFAGLGSEFTQALVKTQGQRPPILGLPGDLIENAVGRSADLIRSLTEEQIGRASEIINRGVITGKSPFQIASELSKSFNKSLPRMETIARTEMLGIHSQVQKVELEGIAQNVPGTKKQWVSVIDDRTRLSHRDAHLQSVPVDKPFIVGITVRSGGIEVIRGSEEMDRPRDPAASAGNIINCRCTMVPDFSDVNGEEPLSGVERPPVAAPLAGLGRKVAKSVRKGFGRLR